MEITQEIAERIINSKVIIDESLVPFKGVEISHIGYLDANGEPFMWEETEEEFALVSFKAMNPYQLNLAVEEFQNEEFEECVNHNLVMRMNVEKARKLSAGTTGTLICHEIEVEDEDGNEVIMLAPKSYSAAESKAAKKVSLADLLGKSKDKGDKKASKSKDKKSKKVEIDDEFEAPKKAKKDKDGKKDKKDKKAKIKA